MDELIKNVRENTDYKVLSKEDYEKLLARVVPKDTLTSTPQVKYPDFKPKFNFQASIFPLFQIFLLIPRPTFRTKPNLFMSPNYPHLMVQNKGE